MKTLTDEEFKQKYGVAAASEFDGKTPETNLFETIKNDIKKRGEKNVNLIQQGAVDRTPMQNVTKGFEVAANTAGAVGDVAGEAIQRTPVVGGVVKQVGSTIGNAFKALTDKFAGTKFFQEAAAGLEDGNSLEQGLSIGKSAGEVAGNVLGADVGLGAAKGAVEGTAKGATQAIESIPKPDLGAATKYATGALRDVIPTSQSIIDHQLAKALDLTPGDLAKIESSTGNQVGKFLADNNLIGTNKATTQALVKGFFDKNYKDVRKEIGSVEKAYKMNQVPRYADALKAINSKIEGVPGLEDVAVKIDNLMNLGKDVKLADVQEVKELLDDHFNLYKVTGDVGEGVAKEGLANIRSELKGFIENEVKANTGKDIQTMNRNVQTSKSLNDAITARSPRGLTRANITTRDAMMGLGLTYFGSPLLGMAAILVGKIATSPTMRLRLARFLDSKGDAYRSKLSEELKNGKVPQEVEEAVTSVK